MGSSDVSTAQDRLDTQSEEMLGVTAPDPRCCYGCKFSHGKPPFEDDPGKAYCKKYPRSKGLQKPREVLYGGDFCDYFVPDPHG